LPRDFPRKPAGLVGLTDLLRIAMLEHFPDKPTNFSIRKMPENKALK
jgi:hypothetical protein